jgi:hypothetical protein
MSERDFSRRAPWATCEDYDDDFEDAVVDARPSANVAAKRSRPELLPKASFERRRNDGNDSGYGSRAGTVGSGSPNRREKKVVSLKVDTNVEERESRPYHYTAPKTEARQPSTRSSADPAVPKTVEPKKYYKHREGECWVCDKFGKHIEPPPGTPVPTSPTATRRPSTTEDCGDTQPSQAQPRVRRSSSNRGPRPASMYMSTVPVGLYDTKTLPSPFAQEAPSYATASWQTPTTPLNVHYTPLTPVTYAQYPVATSSQMVTPVETQGSCFQSLPPAKTRPTRPVQPSRRASMYEQSDRPVVQLGNSTSARSREENERAYDRRPPLHTQKSSHDRDLDRRAMPPPPRPQQEQVLLAHRPSVKKAATSTSTTALRRHSQSYESNVDEFPRLEVIRERRAEASLPPTSYRGPSAAVQDRPSNRKSVSYDLPRQSVEVATRAVPMSEPLGRHRVEPSPVERHEAEAEAYQRRRGTSDTRGLQSHSLTAEALRKVPKVTPVTARSETNSSQKSRNSSSKGSSGGKTGPSSSDIRMRINGIDVGIPVDSGQRITIQSKGVNISVGGKGRSTDKEYPSSRIGRAPSITSRTSKTSSSRGKERRLEHDNGMRVLRDDEIHTPDRAGRRSQSISRYVSRDQEEEPIAYGA